MELTPQQIRAFQEAVWGHHRAFGREMPWRESPTPYFVLVSELMLQQTQVVRVLPKFETFIKVFPTIDILAAASLGDILGLWSGLGYNRRAKFLHEIAQTVVKIHGGHIPSTSIELVKLPGIGQNTAGAIMAYAFNQPVIFIETNIRSVYFYHFFDTDLQVDDQELMPPIKQTLDHDHPRQWYWALMDYGTYLKQTVGNNIGQSRHYTKQSRFEGSKRQIRGKILKLLVEGAIENKVLAEQIADPRLDEVVAALVQEGFIVKDGQKVQLIRDQTL